MKLSCQIHPPAALTPVKMPLCPPDTRLGELQNQSGSCGIEKHFCPCQESNTGSPTRSPSLYRLRYAGSKVTVGTATKLQLQTLCSQAISSLHFFSPYICIQSHRSAYSDGTEAAYTVLSVSGSIRLTFLQVLVVITNWYPQDMSVSNALVSEAKAKPEGNFWLH